MTAEAPRIFAAIEYAARAHAGQYRKGTEVPYIVHPLRVAGLLIEHGASGEVAVAGVLHDTVEDTRTTLQAIEEIFGRRVSALVAGVTEHDRRAPWETRKAATIAALRTAPVEVLWISCADKVDNVRSMQRGEAREGELFWQRFSRPRAKQAWYYRSVLGIIRQRVEDASDLHRLSVELERRVDDLFGIADAAVAARGSAPGAPGGPPTGAG